VRKLDCVKEINIDDTASGLMIILDDIQSTIPEVVRSIVYAGGMVLSVNVLRPSLEEAYLKLVKVESG